MAVKLERISTVLPDSSEQSIVGHLLTLFQQARQHRRPLVGLWDKSYRIMRNRTWLNARPQWLPSPEVPEIYPIIGSLVGWMTDQRPTFNVVSAGQPSSPTYEHYSNVGKDLETVLQSLWVVHKFESEVEKLVWDGFTYGTGILKIGWDSSLDRGLGNAVMRRVDPRTFYPDPQATTLEDANYFFEVRTMSLQEMDRRWPGSADQFTDGSVTHDLDVRPNLLDGNSTIPRANPAAISPATSPRYGRPGMSRLSASHIADNTGVTVFECWIRDHERWTDRETDPDDPTIRVYDCWRVIVFAGNKIIMDERADDLWEDGRHPYERFVTHDNGEFWGWSMVEYLTPMQLAINRLLASIEHNIDLTGNPVFLEETGSGLPRQSITNQPGQRVTVNPNKRAEWLMPPPIHPAMPEMIRFYIGEMERVSGLSAIVRGMSPGGRQASSVLDSVQEASFVRVRMALRNLEWTLRAAGERTASLVVENYTVPRILAITGNEGQQTATFLKGRHFFVPTSGGGNMPLRFSLMVEAGSSLPTSHQARAQEADVLFAMGGIDRIALLEAHNYPNRANINQRIQNLEAIGQFSPPGARQRSQRTK